MIDFPIKKKKKKRRFIHKVRQFNHDFIYFTNTYKSHP